ncbi:beta-N-acetylhexosaminidase [Stackebrandtia albiflava]|uniref:beta-N-acetylhexosaminidase n=1 Tax=Stackebrandtia albiflava TaxID=406432 RepID=A0A562V9T0_9ACTN|nr:glycoside hydrolase family 3 protein [Stackebrandtia albiflava]TWJ14601.1 beta-N-acetylhexosaminidase [Stackebrandtia albiflava]
MTPHDPNRRRPRLRRALALDAILLAFVLSATACAAEPADPVADEPSPTDPSRVWAERKLATLTLAQKVGQLFITQPYGADADAADDGNRTTHGVDTPAELVRRYHLGGVIYFGWSGNITDPARIAALSNGLQQAALDDTGIPLLVSTDQEHGAVVRIGPPVTQFPGNLALGATGDPDQARRSAEVIGAELRAMGLNQNWAPVADVNVNPANPVIGNRSFGGDPARVAEFTAAAVAGYQDGPAGIAASAKHFPGHGDTDVDSHTDLPVITHDLDEWRRLDAPPFKAAVDAGIDVIMSAHIRFPELDDSGTPATLSKPILTGLLRDELGFDGVVVTDSLAMEGVRIGHTDAEVPVKALQAGADLLLMPPDIATAVDGVMAAVESGDLTEARIDESVLRILELKHRRGIVDAPMTDPDAVTTIGDTAHRQVAADVAAASITLLRDDSGALPIGRRDTVLVTGSGDRTVAGLAEAITANGPTTRAHATGEDPDDALVETVTDAARGVDAVVVVTRDVASHPGQERLVAALAETGRPVIAVSVAAPYDANRLPADVAVLASYSHLPVSLRAAAAVVCGTAEATGRLPVEIPAADRQTVLYPIGHH